ncbi:MAG: FecR family protein [Gammaproteobacteria bacterium]|nr:FecR family protein [Gammaproteobacteria bacterium]MDH3805966.1 FecR family protein [Gammaproteobacteria bacterium]
MRTNEAVEELLEHAAPRPAPPSDDEEIVRDAVYAQWQTVTGRRRTRRRMTQFAIAATVLLAVAVSFNALQVSDVEPLQVATIGKSHGSIYLLGEQSELHEMTDLTAISAGQVIVTGDAAGIGLEWGNGGSLRIDENTRIEFRSADSVYLQSGRIYFDSQPSQSVAAITGSGFEITTDHGSVKHVGTQYMTLADADRLTVSVREGRVAVDGVYVAEAVALEGQQLTVSGGARPTVVNFSGHGEAWNWVEATAPAADVDGRTVDEFLQWVGRETGLQVAYESPAAEEKAREGVLFGNVDMDMDPRDKLQFRMSGEDLDYRIDGGTINVSAIDSGSRP